LLRGAVLFAVLAHLDSHFAAIRAPPLLSSLLREQLAAVGRGTAAQVIHSERLDHPN
jgi:hypothetical protein